MNNTNYQIKFTSRDMQSYKDFMIDKFMKLELGFNNDWYDKVIEASLSIVEIFTDNQYYEKFNVNYKNNQNKVLTVNEDNYMQLYNIVKNKIDDVSDNKLEPTILEKVTENFLESVKAISEYNQKTNKKEENEALKFRNILSEDDEIKHITTFIKNHWDGMDKFDSEAMLKMVWNEGLKSGRKLVDEYAVFNIAKIWNEERNDLEIWQNKNTSLDFKQIQNGLDVDYINNFSKNLIFTSISFMKTNANESWDYEEICNKILQKVKKDYPESTKARPHGWKKLAKDYEEYDGMTEYSQNVQKQDNEEFNGIDSGSAGSYGFPKRVSLPQVMYDDKEQFRKPLETLVGAVIGHLYAFNCQNNAGKIINDIYDMKEKLSENVHFKTIVQEIKFVEGKTDNEFEIDISNYNSLTKKAIKHIKENIDISTPEEIEKILKKENKITKKL